MDEPAEVEAAAEEAVADEVAESQDSAITVDASKKRVGNNITNVGEDEDHPSTGGNDDFL